MMRTLCKKRSTRAATAVGLEKGKGTKGKGAKGKGGKGKAGRNECNKTRKETAANKEARAATAVATGNGEGGKGKGGEGKGGKGEAGRNGCNETHKVTAVNEEAHAATATGTGKKKGAKGKGAEGGAGRNGTVANKGKNGGKKGKSKAMKAMKKKPAKKRGKRDAGSDSSEGDDSSEESDFCDGSDSGDEDGETRATVASNKGTNEGKTDADDEKPAEDDEFNYDKGPWEEAESDFSDNDEDEESAEPLADAVCPAVIPTRAARTVDTLFPYDKFRESCAAEVQGVRELCQGAAFKVGEKEWVCPLCPAGRTFDRGVRLKGHVEDYHTPEKNYMCSGRSGRAESRQHALAKSMADHDLLSVGSLGTDYIRRAAKLMRSALPASELSPKDNKANHLFGYLYTATGVSIVSTASLKDRTDVVMVGEVYCDGTFMDFTFRTGIRSQGLIDQVMHSYIFEAQMGRGELASLVSTNRKWWVKVLEAVFFSDAAEKLVTDAKERLHTEDDYSTLSIDGHMKCCLPVKGQAPNRTKKALKKEYPLHGADAVNCVITGITATGAVVFLEPQSVESNATIIETIEDNIPAHHHKGIGHVAVDKPGPDLFRKFRALTGNDNLQMSCDPPHVSFTWESVCMSKKKKPAGSSTLRKIMKKFSSPHHPESTIRKDYFDGDDAKGFDGEKFSSEGVFDKVAKDVDAAKRILDSIDTTYSWRSRKEFVRHIAALCACYPEVAKMWHHSNERLRACMINRCRPSSFQWFYNWCRHVNSGPPGEVLTATGTCANEALHNQLRSMMVRVTKLHAGTLRLKLRMFLLKKILSHGAAAYRPTLRTMTERMVTARIAGILKLWPRGYDRSLESSPSLDITRSNARAAGKIKTHNAKKGAGKASKKTRKVTVNNKRRATQPVGKQRAALMRTQKK
jgi:hypothetical protein